MIANLRMPLLALVTIEVLLCIAHLMWPEYQWGQGRKSYFNFNNRLTPATWLVTAQLIATSLFFLAVSHKETLRKPFWVMAAIVALAMSALAFTRFHHVINGIGSDDLGEYQYLLMAGFSVSFLLYFGESYLHALGDNKDAKAYAVIWLTLWVIYLLIPESDNLYLALISGVTRLFGATAFLYSAGLFLFGYSRDSGRGPQQKPAPFHAWNLYAGVFGTTFTIIFLQIILFQLLTIFNNYNSANSVISTALLGISIGGLLAYHTDNDRRRSALALWGLLLPFAILLSFGAAVALHKSTILAPLLLTVPFIACGYLITAALTFSDSYRIYFFDLLGAALGAILLNSALVMFREESGLLFLSAFTFITAIFFIRLHPVKSFRAPLITLALLGSAIFITGGYLNLETDWLNVVRAKVSKQHKKAETLFSRSSFVGRYDIVRRQPDSSTLKSYDNGRTIDTIRPNPVEDFAIDPRMPNNMYDNPAILIIGLSGDGVTKTGRFLSNDVHGVEINPSVVDLMTGELVPYNGDNYKDITVELLDGRSYLERNDKAFDMITLLNAHYAKGGVRGRSAAPEYLNTLEAAHMYLDHLTPRGTLIIEEPANNPLREAHPYKQLVTLKKALEDRGAKNPERHFFVFRWITKTNNYIQILMKKTPFTKDENILLKKWLKEVDDIRKIEKEEGVYKGPIKNSVTTMLSDPYIPLDTNFSKIIRGQMDREFMVKRNVTVITDDKPFPFRIDPASQSIKDGYVKTLIVALLVLPFCFAPLFGREIDRMPALRHMFIVMFTGAAYLLIEVTLIQHLGIFIGSPIVTFTLVLGTLFIFSGIGSLSSGAMKQKGLWISLLTIIVLLVVYIKLSPIVFAATARNPLLVKMGIAVILIAPIAFFMGVPFPYTLRTAAKDGLPPTLLFAMNGALGALAVPLAMNTSTAWGLTATAMIGVSLYLLVGLLFLSARAMLFTAVTNVVAAMALLTLLYSPWLTCDVEAYPKALDKHEVYAVSYGSSEYKESRAIKGGAPSKKVSFDWFYWVIKSDDGVTLVDTGFGDRNKARKKEFTRYERPVVKLRELGIEPDDVRDIIVTHGHWDHIGSLSDYPNANIHIQQKEFDSIKEKTDRPGVKALLTAENEGRLKLKDGSAVFAPGIDITAGGGHTIGSQYVTVKTLDGPVIIGGDTAYLYKSIDRYLPTGANYDENENISAIREMNKKAASPFFILPGHDKRVLKKFPQVAPKIAYIGILAK